MTVFIRSRNMVRTAAYGGNSVHRYICRSFRAEFSIREAEFSGYYELSSKLNPPFNKIYLKKSNTKGHCPAGTLSLKFKSDANLNELCKETQLVWEQGPSDGIELRSCLKT
jgi:hypothetical protein